MRATPEARRTHARRATAKQASFNIEDAVKMCLEDTRLYWQNRAAALGWKTVERKKAARK